MSQGKKKHAGAPEEQSGSAFAYGVQTSKDKKKKRRAMMTMDMQEIVQALARQEERLTGLAERMDKLEKLTESVHTLAISVERLTNQQASTENQITVLTGDVGELKNKPAKRWDLVITALITAAISAGVTLLIK